MFLSDYHLTTSVGAVNFARIVPDGLLVFFPSYYLLNSCIEAWQTLVRKLAMSIQLNSKFVLCIKRNTQSCSEVEHMETIFSANNENVFYGSNRAAQAAEDLNNLNVLETSVWSCHANNKQFILEPRGIVIIFSNTETYVLWDLGCKVSEALIGLRFKVIWCRLLGHQLLQSGREFVKTSNLLWNPRSRRFSTKPMRSTLLFCYILCMFWPLTCKVRDDNCLNQYGSILSEIIWIYMVMLISTLLL